MNVSKIVATGAFAAFVAAGLLIISHPVRADDKGGGDNESSKIEPQLRNTCPAH
jgi:hypothetical protein